MWAKSAMMESEAMVAMEAITMEMCRIEERVVCSSSLSSLSSTASHHRFAALLVLLAGREEGQEMVLRVRRKQLVLDAAERASRTQTR